MCWVFKDLTVFHCTWFRGIVAIIPELLERALGKKFSIMNFLFHLGAWKWNRCGMPCEALFLLSNVVASYTALYLMQRPGRADLLRVSCPLPRPCPCPTHLLHETGNNSGQHGWVPFRSLGLAFIREAGGGQVGPGSSAMGDESASAPVRMKAVSLGKHFREHGAFCPLFC